MILRRKNNIKKGSRTSYLVGERYQNSCKSWYEIAGYPEDPRRRYIQFDSGYECCPLISQLNNGKVRDLNSKHYYGIASLGMKNGTEHPLYWRWFNMVGRCYNKKHSQYKFYGAKGVTVSDELLNFKQYVDIVSSLDNYDELIQAPTLWDIDKDLKCCGIKQYNKNTLSIIPKVDNSLYGQKDKIIKVEMYSDDMELLAIFPSIKKAGKVTNIDAGSISQAIKECCMAGEYYWRKCE